MRELLNGTGEDFARGQRINERNRLSAASLRLCIHKISIHHWTENAARHFRSWISERTSWLKHLPRTFVERGQPTESIALSLHHSSVVKSLDESIVAARIWLINFTSVTSHRRSYEILNACVSSTKPSLARKFWPSWVPMRSVVRTRTHEKWSSSSVLTSFEVYSESVGGHKMNLFVFGGKLTESLLKTRHVDTLSL